VRPPSCDQRPSSSAQGGPCLWHAPPGRLWVCVKPAQFWLILPCNALQLVSGMCVVPRLVRRRGSRTAADCISCFTHKLPFAIYQRVCEVKHGCLKHGCLRFCSGFASPAFAVDFAPLPALPACPGVQRCRARRCRFAIPFPVGSECLALASRHDDMPILPYLVDIGRGHEL